MQSAVEKSPPSSPRVVTTAHHNGSYVHQPRGTPTAAAAQPDKHLGPGNTTAGHHT
jgi:hypothetical protein